MKQPRNNKIKIHKWMQIKAKQKRKKGPLCHNTCGPWGEHTLECRALRRSISRGWRFMRDVREAWILLSICLRRSRRLSTQWNSWGNMRGLKTAAWEWSGCLRSIRRSDCIPCAAPMSSKDLAQQQKPKKNTKNQKTKKKRMLPVAELPWQLWRPGWGTTHGQWALWLCVCGNEGEADAVAWEQSPWYLQADDGGRWSGKAKLSRRCAEGAPGHMSGGFWGRPCWGHREALLRPLGGWATSGSHEATWNCCQGIC